jgi:hypothetical protein
MCSNLSSKFFNLSLMALILFLRSRLADEGLNGKRVGVSLARKLTGLLPFCFQFQGVFAMDLANIGNQIKTSLTGSWQKVTIVYQSSIIPVVRVIFNTLNRLTGPIGAHLILGGFALGLFYMGRQIWRMKMGTYLENDKLVIIGPQNRLLQIMLRIAGVAEMLLAATIVGGLIVVAGGPTALALGATATIGLIGLFV